MSTNPAFAEFRELLATLADQAPTNSLTDTDRLARATAACIAGLDRRLVVDMDTCIHCGLCAEACHFFIASENERYTPAYKAEPLRRIYRRELSPMRWLYRPFVKALDIDDLNEWRELVYGACTGCGRCDMMCPMGINISEGIDIVRAGIAAAGMAPDELRTLERQQEDNALFGVGADKLRSTVERYAGEGLQLPLDRDRADVLLLTTAIELRLFPETLAAYAKILNKAGADWTLSSDAFDATNIGLISGDRATRRRAMQRIVDAARKCGACTVVVPESGHAYQALRWECAEELGEALSFDVLAISEFVAREVNAGRLSIGNGKDGGSVTYHDPCRLGRRGGVFREPREVLGLLGLEVCETESNGRENLCCGGGCGEFAVGGGAALRQKAFDLKRHELDHTKADKVITGCSNCRINLMIGAANSGWEMPIASFAETVAAELED